MKIDKLTLGIIQNLSNFNNSLYIEKGNILRTISQETKSLYIKATVPTNFEIPFGVYEINKFLGAISLFEDPNFQFHKNYVTISDIHKSIDFYYADQKTIPDVKKGNPPDFPIDLHLNLDSSKLRDIQKASGILGLNDVSIFADGENAYLQVEDIQKKTDNNYKTWLCKCNNNFKALYSNEIFKLMPSQYRVNISFKGITYFISENITYYAAMKYGSTYE